MAQSEQGPRAGRDHPQGAPGLASTPDGRLLYYQAVEGPEPTVVFEGGIASTRSIWGLVQPALRGDARAVAYDRSGLGRSPRTDRPRRLPDLAADLNALLDHLDEDRDADGDGGFVLVGHSWGGPIVRTAAAARTGRVRGLVLVDPADEDCAVYYSPMNERVNAIQAALFPPLARVGLLRRLYALTARRVPAQVRADLRAEMYTPDAVATQIAESAAMAEDLRALRASPIDVPDVPLTIISGGLDAGLGARARAQMNAAHAARAQRSDLGRHVVAERSGHVVMMSEPDLVADEVRRLVAGLRAPR